MLGNSGVYQRIFEDGILAKCYGSMLWSTRPSPPMAPQVILGRGEQSEQSHRFVEEGIVGGAVPKRSESLGKKSEIHT